MRSPVRSRSPPPRSTARSPPPSPRRSAEHERDVVRAEWQTAQYVREDEGVKASSSSSVTQARPLTYAQHLHPSPSGKEFPPHHPRMALWDAARVAQLAACMALLLAVTYRFGGWAVDWVAQGPLSKDPWKSREYLMSLGLGWDAGEQGCKAGAVPGGGQQPETCCAKAWSLLDSGEVQVKGVEPVVAGCPAVDWALPPVSMPQWEALVQHTSGAGQYVEWGSGGTTESVSPLAANALSIEHFQPACRCAESRLFLQAERKARCLNFVCVDTELDLDKFGSPSLRNTQQEKQRAWESYVNAIDGNLQSDHVDVVVVNGVARVGCAVKSLAYAHGNTTVLVHDWPRNYEEHLVLYFDVLDVIEPHWSIDRSLAVLKPKAEYLGDTQLYKQFLGSWG